MECRDDDEDNDNNDDDHRNNKRNDDPLGLADMRNIRQAEKSNYR